MSGTVNRPAVAAHEDLNWKGAIKALLILGDVTLPEKGDSKAFEIMKNYPFFGDGIMKIEGILKIIYPGREHSYVNDAAHFYEASGDVSQVMRRLIDMELVVKKPDIIFAKGEELFKLHSLTNRGLDVALKFQEHEDNERRHNTTASYSRKAFWVSLVALAFAAISMILSYLRLDIYEDEVQRLRAAQTPINYTINTK